MSKLGLPSGFSKVGYGRPKSFKNPLSLKLPGDEALMLADTIVSGVTEATAVLAVFGIDLLLAAMLRVLAAGVAVVDEAVWGRAVLAVGVLGASFERQLR